MSRFASVFAAKFVAIWSFIVPVVRVVVLGLVIAGLWTGLRRSKSTSPGAKLFATGLSVALVAWLVFVWIAATHGWMQGRIGGVVPVLPLFTYVPLAIGLPIVLRSATIGAVLDAIPTWWLVRLQFYRILGMVFIVRWMQGDVPGIFALPAGIGDTLTGVLALFVAFALRTNKPNSRTLGFFWNAFGLLDFVVALSLGTLTATSALQQLLHLHLQSNPFITTYPLAMIPGHAVPFSILLHALSIRQLRRSRANVEIKQQGTSQPLMA